MSLEHIREILGDEEMELVELAIDALFHGAPFTPAQRSAFARWRAIGQADAEAVIADIAAETARAVIRPVAA
jgi:hypothetical protein